MISDLLQTERSGLSTIVIIPVHVQHLQQWGLVSVRKEESNTYLQLQTSQQAHLQSIDGQQPAEYTLFEACAQDDSIVAFVHIVPVLLVRC